MKAITISPKFMLKLIFVLLSLPTSILIILGKRELLKVAPWSTIAKFTGYIGLAGLCLSLISIPVLFRKGWRYGWVNVIILLIWCFVFLTVITGCGGSNQANPPNQSAANPPAQQVVAKVPEGRPETRSLNAASLVGHDGPALRKMVDGVLDKNDKHQKELEEAEK
jgi:hypothetical protein